MMLQLNIRMMKTGFTFTLLILQIAFNNSWAQEQPSGHSQAVDIAKQLDDYVTSANKAFRFNGSALVAQKGKILLQKGYGWRDAGTMRPNKPDTRFPILSITKPFTATVILKLQEEG